MNVRVKYASYQKWGTTRSTSELLNLNGSFTKRNSEMSYWWEHTFQDVKEESESENFSSSLISIRELVVSIVLEKD